MNDYNPNFEAFKNMGKAQKEAYLKSVAENFTQIDAGAMIHLLDDLLEGKPTATADIFNLYERISNRTKRDKEN